MYDPDDPGEYRRAEGLARRTGERAIRFGGTCTGEHGIGLHRRDLLDLEHGPAVAIMRTIKQALDPLGIMNPGKMLSGVRPSSPDAEQRAPSRNRRHCCRR
jgi:D-lactate dehydrogenase (cytochrome)